MCIVFFKFRMDEMHPIMLGSNREENLLRRSSGFQHDANIVCAGLDFGPQGNSEQAGTWLGANLKNKLLIAVTNRDDGFKRGTSSRGRLCKNLLELTTAEEASDYVVATLTNYPNMFSGANYIILSPKSGYVVHAPDKNRIECVRVRKGIHAITTLDLDDPNDERINFVKSNLSEDGTSNHFTDAAKFLCAHNKIVIDDPEWGTVSSAIFCMSDYNFVANVSTKVPTSSLSYKEYVI